MAERDEMLRRLACTTAIVDAHRRHIRPWIEVNRDEWQFSLPRLADQRIVVLERKHDEAVDQGGLDAPRRRLVLGVAGDERDARPLLIAHLSDT